MTGYLRTASGNSTTKTNSLQQTYLGTYEILNARNVQPKPNRQSHSKRTRRQVELLTSWEVYARVKIEVLPVHKLLLEESRGREIGRRLRRYIANKSPSAASWTAG